MNKFERFKLHDCSRICDKILDKKTYVDTDIIELRNTVKSVKDAEYSRYLEYSTQNVRDRYYQSYNKLVNALSYVPSGDKVYLQDIKNLKNAIEAALEFDKGFNAYSTWYTGMRLGDDTWSNTETAVPNSNSYHYFSTDKSLVELLENVLGFDSLKIGKVSESQIINELNKHFTIYKNEKGYAIYNLNMRLDISHWGYIGSFVIETLRFHVNNEESYFEYVINNTSKGFGSAYGKVQNEFSRLGINLQYNGYRYHATYKGVKIDLSSLSHGYDVDEDNEEVDIFIRITLQR